MKELQSHRVAGLRAGALLACVLLAAAAPARAQQPQPPQSPPQVDPRWEAWLGCWEPVSGPVRVAGDTSSTPLVCVIPSPGSVGVDVATIAGGRILSREQVEATGEQRSVTREGCSGWESAQFSTDGQRIFLTAQYTCPGNLKRTTHELFAITPSGEWLDVRGAVARGLPQGVRVLRYRPADGSAAVPGDLAWALQGNAMAVSTARDAAGAPPEIADVVEATHALAPAVVEAWLIEEGEGFALNGHRLVGLKSEGVPGRVIDVMVALSYPRVFAINLASRRAERRAPAPGYYDRRPDMYAVGYGSPYGCYSPFAWDCYSPFGWGYYSPYLYSPYGYYSPYGSWSGYGFYPAGGVIVVTGGGGQVARHGRMVIGRGYTAGSTGQTARPAGSSGSQGRPSGSSSSGGGSSSGGRRAVPKP